ncbi:PAS domain S-box-containing protein/diguanylate cyclase (GGDEF) domain-containing protein [Rhizobium sp. NFR07]|uniref:diguanylate cyclase domain-containing protein n=1 Tax=Rhizobium sp. NFR07 TaxID=1566262 RepID=UPI0008E32CCF|nr:diguanylate cyclase [Rhizobium sp. NFR07]SFB04772.1 PAS domain S-box-containing protein/diguanylate cyclase (GGDEF) domain-containing protein [Rhizobium sp. NFR07]
MAGLASQTMISDVSTKLRRNAAAQSPEALRDPLQIISLQDGARLDEDLDQALNDLPALGLLDQLSDYVSVRDREGRYVFCNQVVCRATGADDGAELTGKTDFDFIEEKIALRLSTLEKRVLATGVAVEKHEEKCVLATGRTLWLSISKTPLRNDLGEIIGVVEVSRDITERKRQEDLRHGHARLLEMIARGQPIDVVLKALIKLAENQLDDVRGAIMLTDESGKRLTSGAAPSLPAAYARLIDGLEVGASRGSCGTAAWRREPVIVKDVNSDPLWEDFRELGPLFGFRSCWSTPIIGAEARVLGTFALYAACVREPTALELELMTMATDLAGIAIERDLSERRIRHMAHHDALTGLPNRALFWSQFGDALKQAKREARRLTVAYLDLDNFKDINDTFGHAAGDEVLKTVAARMARYARASDLLVRLGGDEFAVVFDDTDDRNAALDRLDALKDLITRPIALQGRDITANCSMGIAFFPVDGDAPDELLASADHAMYRDKEVGRGGQGPAR